MRETNPELHRQRVSESLRGKFGEESRRWKGNDAGYVAIHLWLVKHFGKADHCDYCNTLWASRYEWANKYHSESRNRDDYIQLCPSCHRLFDQQNKCRKGHPYTPQTTYVNIRGHRRCLICKG
ncbi:hypothetical protein LCGC14_1694100 [marine sediment metagenome]|uniref:Uncharacterized protein n=1 Tax=marine sediment metagenome TaxID=412755 RepID=A0A0F9K0I9_9ZZZZ